MLRAVRCGKATLVAGAVVMAGLFAAPVASASEWLRREGGSGRSALASVRFVGNVFFSDTDLQALIQQEQWNRSDSLGIEQIVALVTRHYEEWGFPAVRITEAAGEGADGKLTTVLMIQEGAQVLVESVSFIGARQVRAEHLAGASGLIVGDYYSRKRFRRAFVLLSQNLAKLGYKGANVEGIVRLEDGGANLVFAIEEGERGNGRAAGKLN